VATFAGGLYSAWCSPQRETVRASDQMIFEPLVSDPEKEHVVGREILIDPELVLHDSTAPARKTSGTPG